MSKVTASNVSTTISTDKLEEFFKFSGQVDKISKVSDSTFTVAFKSPEGSKNALLLNGVELEGKPIKIESSDAVSSSAPPTIATTSSAAPESTTAALAGAVGLTPAGIAANEKTSSAPASTSATTSSTPPTTDIDQEHKPKSAVVAEYLSQGYVLSDDALQKAIALDQKHGISTKFKSFLGGLDSKYHIQEKANDYKLEEKLSKGKSDLSKYFNKAVGEEKGQKIHEFYTGLVSDTKQIHEEAKRLAELKKQKAATTSSTGTTYATGEKN